MLSAAILTWNEEPNLASTLTALHWVPRIVVVDSGSTDKTETIARSFSNVIWVVRPFDSHRRQWEFAISQAALSPKDWILALDADMKPGDGFQEESLSLCRQSHFVAATVPFEYRLIGKRLRGSLYPRQIRLFQKHRIRISQEGHSQEFVSDGPIKHFRSKLIHEDKKSTDRWLHNQAKYASLEARRILESPALGPKDHLRLLGVSPILWGIYGWLRSGGPLTAPASVAYACERLTFEAMLVRALCNARKRDA